MLILDYLRKECISTDLKGENKEEVLKELAELQFNCNPEVDRQEAFDSLFEREALLSTGIGEGIAIPHARIKSCTKISVAFGLLKKDIDFSTLDNKPVRIIFLIFFPKDEVSLQIRFLARVSRLLKQTSLHNDLFKCNNQEDVIKTIKQYEKTHFH